MNISKLIGLDDRINDLIEDAFRETDDNVSGFKTDVKATIDSMVADVYSNMKQIDEQKYRMVEMETKLSNLEVFVKLHLPGGGE